MKETTAVKAVIFDWAGTIVDFGCIAPAIVFVEVFAKNGIKISIDQARGPMGLAKRDHVNQLLLLDEVTNQWMKKNGRSPNENDLNTLYAELEPAMAHIANEYSIPIRGAVDLITELKQHGIKTGSSTGYVESIMRNVIPVAQKHGLVLDSVISSSDVTAGRPAPYMCYKNAIALEVFPMNQMIKIGDTVADIKEGLNAGMWTIGLTQSGNEVGLSEEEFAAIDPIAQRILTTRASEKLSEAGAHYIADGIWDCLAVIEQINTRIENGEMPVLPELILQK